MRHRDAARRCLVASALATFCASTVAAAAAFDAAATVLVLLCVATAACARGLSFVAEHVDFAGGASASSLWSKSGVPDTGLSGVNGAVN